MVTTNVKSHTSLCAFLTASPFWQLFIVLTAGTESCGYLLAPFSALYPVNWIPFLWTHSVCKTTSSRCLLSHPSVNSSGLCVSGETPAFVLCLFGRVCDEPGAEGVSSERNRRSTVVPKNTLVTQRKAATAVSSAVSISQVPTEKVLN
jgi:hypothetical protein